MGCSQISDPVSLSPAITKNSVQTRNTKFMLNSIPPHPTQSALPAASLTPASCHPAVQPVSPSANSGPANRPRALQPASPTAGLRPASSRQAAQSAVSSESANCPPACFTTASTRPASCHQLVLALLAALWTRILPHLQLATIQPRSMSCPQLAQGLLAAQLLSSLSLVQLALGPASCNSPPKPDLSATSFGPASCSSNSPPAFSRPGHDPSTNQPSGPEAHSTSKCPFWEHWEPRLSVLSNCGIFVGGFKPPRSQFSPCPHLLMLQHLFQFWGLLAPRLRL